MNTKAIAILKSTPLNPPVFALFLCLTLSSVLCVAYVAGIGSYFVAGSSAAVVHVVDSDDVLKQLGTIRDNRLGEVSGIAISMHDSNKFWVHNDSGNPAELFLIDSTGSVQRSIKLKGVFNRDWEDICTFKLNESAYICVGDVGDNVGRHKEYWLYFVKEPDFDQEQSAATASTKPSVETSDFQKIKFRYEDGPKNCEAFAWDASSKGILLAEKGFDRKRKDNLGIYRLDLANGFDNHEHWSPAELHVAS